MKKRSRKSIIKRSILSVIVISVIVWLNLNAHAVYYVSHMPQKQDILVVAGVLADQLPWLDDSTYEGYKTEPRYRDYLKREREGEREYISQFSIDESGLDIYIYIYMTF